MTVLVKYARQTNETNKILFQKLNNLSSLEWARWGGWFDSDGCFSYNKKKKNISCVMALTDKSPVELFSTVFESNLRVSYRKTKYEESTGAEGKAKYVTVISGGRALWFCQKVHPFIINKNNKLNNLLNKFQIDLSKHYNNMNSTEFLSWLVSFIEGDGCFTTFRKKYPKISITSNNNYLLDYIRKRCLEENLIEFGKTTLKQKAGKFKMSSKSNIMSNRKNGYIISAGGKDNLTKFYNLILPLMSLTRKKEKIFKHIEMLKLINARD